MYSYEQIRHVHLEPTTRCNASCPMCARNTRGVTAPGLKMTELGLEQVRRIFPEAFLAQITGFDLCGAYGDPALAAELSEIVAYVRAASPACTITVYSNGGVQTQAWWQRLAGALGSPARVVFAIDGIGETNAIYRRGVKFDKVIENASAFIAAGGVARWEFLAFRHNEEEVEQARELSKELGFEQFSVKKTDRFLQPMYEYVPEYEGGNQDLERFPVFDAKGVLVSHLEPPRKAELVNRTTFHRRELIERFGTLEALFAATPINCRVLSTQSVFVSAQGLAFPCCWTYVQATRPNMCSFPESADRQIQHLVEASGGFERIDALRVGLAAAVGSPLFGAIKSSLSCGGQGRLKVCARACGKDFPAYFDQFSDVQLQPRSLRVLQGAA